jgi:hypothetical protein
MKKVIIILLLLAIAGTASATTVYVQSPPKVWEGETFTVDVKCTPTEEVKSWELNFGFSNTVLEAKEYSGTETTTKGDFFGAYTQFFVDGIIDNPQGKFNDIYNLIVGQTGFATNPGTLVTLKFEALNPGVSPLSLLDVGVTDESQYLAITTTDSTVTVYGIYDMDQNGEISVLDLVFVSVRFGQTGTPGWIHEDIFPDGKISIMDLVLVSNNWGS